MTRAALQEKILRQALLSGVDAFHLADLLNEKSERDLDHVPIKSCSADPRRKRDLADFPQ